MSTKIKQKSALTVINKILAVILAITLVATVLVIWKYPDKTETAAVDDAAASEASAIDEFVPGTYGGVKMDTMEDAVKYYVEAYNYTKTLTCEYKTEDGKTETWYKLLGDEDLNASNILVEGKSNSMVNSLVPSIVNSLFSAGVYGLVPCNNRNPELDNNKEDGDGTLDFTTSYLTVDDVQACNVVENSDGTITMQIQPKETQMATRGKDAQGNFFEALGDIAPTVKSISALSFSSGSIEENFTVTYSGGTGTITIDPATKEITTADYEMRVHIEVVHACITVIKDKSASLDITYKNHYPCSDEYLLESKGATRL